VASLRAGSFSSLLLSRSYPGGGRNNLYTGPSAYAWCYHRGAETTVYYPSIYENETAGRQNLPLQTKHITDQIKQAAL
jgi:hypothetical protein